MAWRRRREQQHRLAEARIEPYSAFPKAHDRGRPKARLELLGNLVEARPVARVWEDLQLGTRSTYNREFDTAIV